MAIGISIGTAFFKSIEEAYEFLKTHDMAEGTCETYFIETQDKNLDILCNRTKQKYRNRKHDLYSGLEHCEPNTTYCRVCGGKEEENLPTSCPGKALTDNQKELLYYHKVDFIMNKWVVK